MTADYTNYFPEEPSRFEGRSLDRLLVFCNRINASDITFQSGSPVMAEIYGRLYTITKRDLSNAEVGDLLNAIYGPNGTTQIMRGQDIDTHYEVRPNRNERYRHRINGVGIHVDGHEGIQITVRTIPSTPPLLADLDLPQSIIKSCAPEEGVVYVTGATGSGKSTLLAAIIRQLAEDPESHRKILTYEAPIEFVYDEIVTKTAIVSQSEVPRHIPSFAEGVRNALRRKPRLILVGEARDTETISAVLEAALTGHPVYTTLHSNGVAETVRRLVGSFSKEERIGRTIDIIETMRLIIWQRLVPSIDGKRIALREYLVFDENVRDELLSVDPERVTAKTRELVQKYGHPMQLEVDKRYEEGVIDERSHKVLSVSLKRNNTD